jgi:hypothetical protein
VRDVARLLWVCCLPLLLSACSPGDAPPKEQPTTRPATQPAQAEPTTPSGTQQVWIDPEFAPQVGGVAGQQPTPLEPYGPMRTVWPNPRLARRLAGAAPTTQPATRPAGLDRYTLSGPFTHANLAVFLVHTERKEPTGEYLTLAEAMTRKKLVVHETGNVGQLTLENNDEKLPVYIQAGDIVKGGRQDRVLAYDLVVPPGSGKVAIASFCVESGRWAQRGMESTFRFGRSSNLAVGKELKLAAKHRGDQSAVWSNVSKLQYNLSYNAGVVIMGNGSPSSLQLSLEHPELKKHVAEYTKALEGATKDRKDVVGMVFTVNGEINSADIYASRKLFAKLWPRLLESAATEAFAEHKKDKTFSAVKAEAVRKWLAGVQRGEITARNLPNGVQTINVETNKDVLFDTILLSPGAARSVQPVHRNIIRKPQKPEGTPTPGPPNQSR